MPNTIWDSKGEYDPKQFEVKSDPTVGKMESAAEKAARQAEEMKKATEMALAAMSTNQKKSAEAVEAGTETLNSVKGYQDSIKK
ncbi:expressed unknown protein [Seminavis robusta]|uniref:Uncharacterized protein n=1 Tax=Seminavis robusta TaxID=568900 RepID=A0A9N8HWB2_9STRA|nr:expressed unknown protein [Seminavis robusta]|eukprot:Sro2134_g315930.1 n/a (84) ;mRNA; f:6103-6354